MYFNSLFIFLTPSFSLLRQELDLCNLSEGMSPILLFIRNEKPIFTIKETFFFSFFPSCQTTHIAVLLCLILKWAYSFSTAFSFYSSSSEANMLLMSPHTLCTHHIHRKACSAKRRLINTLIIRICIYNIFSLSHSAATPPFPGHLHSIHIYSASVSFSVLLSCMCAQCRDTHHLSLMR